jgi:hypothetical protein
MNTRRLRIALAATLAGLMLAVQPAVASRALVIVTGKITAIYGNDRIDVDGKIFKVLSGSTAADSLRQFGIGQVVDVSLDGALADTASRVVSIQLHQR